MAVLAVILALFLALAAAYLGEDEWGDKRCPCKQENHSQEKMEELNLSTYPEAFNFGLGCHVHYRDTEFAKKVYQSDAAVFLKCENEMDRPWCQSKWCYIDETKDCSLDSWQGSLGKISHATCGNVQQGWPEYAMRSLAARLKGPLRVLHIETTLEGGYMGADCSKSGEGCKGLVAEFWTRSLNELKKYNVSVDSKGIKKSNSVDVCFEDIRSSFENYSEFYRTFYKDVLDPSDEPNTTNFDLCAFATGLGWVDLCSGDFALTQEREEMTYLIELYTTAAFLVSKSTCTRIFDEPMWWTSILSEEAWGFFWGCLAFLVLVTCCFDIGCVWDFDHRDSCWKRLKYAADTACRGLVGGMCHAFIHQEGRTNSDLIQVRATPAGEQPAGEPESQKNQNKKSFASIVIRFGLNLFIMFYTTLYFSSLTSDLIKQPKPQGEIPSLADIKSLKSESKVKLCIHKVYQTSMRPHMKNMREHIEPIWETNWEELMEDLENHTCSAAIIEGDAWRTFRKRGRLCDFFKPDTPTFFMPTGAPVSRRAYRTLESFRFNASEVSAFEFDSSDKTELQKEFQDQCPKDSRSLRCEDRGVPWGAFHSMAGISGGLVLCGLLLHGFSKMCKMYCLKKAPAHDGTEAPAVGELVPAGGAEGGDVEAPAVGEPGLAVVPAGGAEGGNVEARRGEEADAEGQEPRQLPAGLESQLKPKRAGFKFSRELSRERSRSEGSTATPSTGVDMKYVSEAGTSQA